MAPELFIGDMIANLVVVEVDNRVKKFFSHFSIPAQLLLVRICLH